MGPRKALAKRRGDGGRRRGMVRRPWTAAQTAACVSGAERFAERSLSSFEEPFVLPGGSFPRRSARQSAHGGVCGPLGDPAPRSTLSERSSQC
ncbi:hypothetical protein V5799_028723, partial [Amblyomma americanum]